MIENTMFSYYFLSYMRFVIVDSRLTDIYKESKISNYFGKEKN